MPKKQKKTAEGQNGVGGRKLPPPPKMKVTENVVLKSSETLKPKPVAPTVEVPKKMSQKEHALKWKRATNQQLRDIAPIPYQDINWERRIRAKDDLKYFCETYLPAVFYLGWSADQIRCLNKVEDICRDGGMFALAMPRGSGKTAVCRGGLIWCTLYGYRTFPFFVGSNAPKATQTLEFIKMYLYQSPLLRMDFPEITWPVYRLENRYHLARGQLYDGEPTYIEWGTDTVRYPSIILPQRIAEAYREHDPYSVRYLPDREVWIPKSAGTVLKSSGIDGSIRGEAEVHPITLEQPRPDLVLLDDVQKDQKADSPVTCAKLINLIDGAVQGLAGPGKHIATLMPCTVIREGDVADTYLDHNKKPEWDGERCAMVMAWPKGITNYEVTNETEEGVLWNQYAEIRRESLRKYKDNRLATEFYQEHQEVMDRGFIVSWKERYDKNTELSAQQHAMNLRLKNQAMFLSEYQNVGRKLVSEAEITITAEQLQEKTIDLNRRQLPPEVEYVTSFIDVQNEILFYTSFACDPDFNGVFCDYGTWPAVNQRYFTKDNAESWSLLTDQFFKAYPEFRNQAVRNTQGKVRAPFEAKIYHALSMAVKHLLSHEFERQDEHRRKFKIMRLGIDTRWGQASDVIKRFIRESGIQNIVPCYGQSFPPTHRQLEEYDRRAGWLFEDQVCPHVKEPKWVVRPNPDGMYYLAMDVSRLKDFLFARLSSPKGSPGSISLFKAPAEDHEMFCHHVCSSEYPVAVAARNIIKNQWTVREGTSFDNDWLDCCVGSMALASTLGASLKTSDRQIVTIHRK